MAFKKNYTFYCLSLFFEHIKIVTSNNPKYWDKVFKQIVKTLIRLLQVWSGSSLFGRLPTIFLTLITFFQHFSNFQKGTIYSILLDVPIFMTAVELKFIRIKIHCLHNNA